MASAPANEGSSEVLIFPQLGHDAARSIFVAFFPAAHDYLRCFRWLVYCLQARYSIRCSLPGFAINSFRISGDADFQRAFDIDFEKLRDLLASTIPITAAVRCSVKDNGNAMSGEKRAYVNHLTIEQIAVLVSVRGLWSKDRP